MDFIKPHINTKNSLYNSTSLLSDEPLFKMQKQMMVLSKNSKSKSIYEQFLADLIKFSLKITSPDAKNIFDIMMSRNLIYLGKLTALKCDLPGSIVVTDASELAGIVLDMNTLDINSKTGITSKCDLAFYSIYFECIRAAVVTNQHLIKQDVKLDNLVQKILVNIFLKLLGANVILNEKQKTFLNYCVSYFYYRFMKNLHHEMAISQSLNFVDSNLESESKYIMKNFDKYERMKDIFKALIDFKITNESPPVLIMKTITKFNMFTFYCLTTSLDYLVAMAVLTMYPTSFFESVGLNTTLQNQLENHINTTYFPKIKFNMAYLNDTTTK